MCCDGRHGLEDFRRDRWGGAVDGKSPLVSPLEGRQVSRQDAAECDQRQGRLSTIAPVWKASDVYGKETKDEMHLGWREAPYGPLP